MGANITMLTIVHMVLMVVLVKIMVFQVVAIINMLKTLKPIQIKSMPSTIDLMQAMDLITEDQPPTEIITTLHTQCLTMVDMVVMVFHTMVVMVVIIHTDGVKHYADQNN